MGFDWIVDDPDDTEGAGYYPSLAFDNNNQAVIAYLHDEGDRLLIAQEVGRSWDIFETDVMNGARPGFYPAIVADSNGDFHVAHYFLAEEKIAYMEGDGNIWTDISTVAQNITIRNMSRALTMAIDPNDHLYLAFLDTGDHTVYLASQSYRSWSPRGVGWGDSSSGSIALAVDENNQYLAFYSGDGLQYIRIRNGTTDQERMIDSGRLIGISPSMAVDGNGNLAIAYYAGNKIKLAINNNGNWTTHLIGDATPMTGDTRRTTSVAFGPDGMIHLCYFDASNRGRLMYAMVNLSGNVVMLQEVDYGGVGLLNSLAIDHQGMPAIAYLDQLGEHLRFAHVDSRR